MIINATIPFIRVRELCRLLTFSCLMVLLETLHALRYTSLHYLCSTSVLELMVLLDDVVYHSPTR